MWKREQVAISHLEVAMAASEDFEYDLKGAGHMGNILFYT